MRCNRSRSPAVKRAGSTEPPEAPASTTALEATAASAATVAPEAPVTTAINIGAIHRTATLNFIDPSPHRSPPSPSDKHRRPFLNERAHPLAPILSPHQQVVSLDRKLQPMMKIYLHANTNALLRLPHGQRRVRGDPLRRAPGLFQQSLARNDLVDEPPRQCLLSRERA